MLRKVIFYTALTFGTSIMSILFIPFIKFDWITKVIRLWPQLALFLLKNICNITYTIIHTRTLPNHRAIIASKHQSALETFALFLAFPKAVFILKKELVNMPLIGSFLKKLGMIYIDRSKGKQAILHIKTQLEKLDSESVVIIFPEGTRTKPDHKTDSYHSGICLVYETLKWPVIPVALNTGIFWPKSGPMKSGKATIQILEPIKTYNYERKEFLEKLNKRIENASIKLYKQTMCSISKLKS